MNDSALSLRNARLRPAALGAALALPVWLACQNTVTLPDTSAGSAGTFAGSAGSEPVGSSGGTGATASNGGGRGGSTLIGVAPEGGAASGEEGGAPGAGGVAEIDRDDACALATDTVVALPPVLELVIDTSGSMDWPPGWAPETPDDSKPPGPTKWEITRTALSEAVASLGPQVALGANFFPNTDDDDEDAGVCLRNEIALTIDELGAASSAQRVAWEAALAGVVPNGGTPTEGAYRYGLERLAARSLRGNRFLLLITDGTPTCTIDCECTEDNRPVDSEPLVERAAEALAAGVRTFVIGSPGSEDTRDVLSELATRGGTSTPGCSDTGPEYCHFDMTTEPDLAAGLTRAFDEVAMNLRSCEYPVPPAPGDQTLDRDRVNVLFTPSDGETRTVPRDPSRSGCQDGWQYSEDESSIVLCGAACDEAKTDLGAKVEVLFGCETVGVEPR